MPNPFDPTKHEEDREANSYWLTEAQPIRCTSNSDFWEPAEMDQQEPQKPGLYLADGRARCWITADTSDAAWGAVVATIKAFLLSNNLAIFARPRLMQISATGIVLKETRDLSLSE